MSPEEDRTHDAVDSEPKHYQLSYSGPWNGIYFSFILLAETIKQWRGGNWSTQRKIPEDKLQKMPHTKARKFKIQPRLKPALYHGGQLGKQMC